MRMVLSVVVVMQGHVFNDGFYIFHGKPQYKK